MIGRKEIKWNGEEVKALYVGILRLTETAPHYCPSSPPRVLANFLAAAGSFAFETVAFRRRHDPPLIFTHAESSGTECLGLPPQIARAILNREDAHAFLHQSTRSIGIWDFKERHQGRLSAVLALARHLLGPRQSPLIHLRTVLCML